MAEVSPEEIRASFTGPAVYSDRFIVNIYQSSVRISFLEHDGISDPAHYRTAVSISHQDAIQLRDLLGQMLAPIEQHLNALKKMAAENAQ